MDATGPTRYPFEVFDNIGDVDLRSIDSRRGKAAVEQLPRRSDEGASDKVFGITRLLADKHYRGVFRPLTKHRLGGVSEQVAAGASSSSVAQSRDRLLHRDQVEGIFGWFGQKSCLE